MQLHIPAYGALRFEDIVVDEPYASVWRRIISSISGRATTWR